MSVNSRNYNINMHRHSSWTLSVCYCWSFSGWNRHLLISHLLLLMYFIWPQWTCQMY